MSRKVNCLPFSFASKRVPSSFLELFVSAVAYPGLATIRDFLAPVESVQAQSNTNAA
jgi:hypothetical protein